MKKQLMMALLLSVTMLHAEIILANFKADTTPEEKAAAQKSVDDANAKLGGSSGQISKTTPNQTNTSPDANQTNANNEASTQIILQTGTIANQVVTGTGGNMPPPDPCIANPSLCAPPPDPCIANPSLCAPPPDPCITNPSLCAPPPPLCPPTCSGL